MRSRFLKHFVYGLFYIVIFGFLGYGFFLYFSPLPACTDGVQNGDETGLDCGGNCLPCAIKDLRSLRVVSTDLLPVSDTESTVVVRLENPNVTYGATDLSYVITGRDTSGGTSQLYSGSSFIYPGEVKFIVLPALTAPRSIISADTTVSALAWAPRNDWKTVSMETRQVSVASDQLFVTISGILRSSEAILFPEVNVSALFYNSAGVLIGASRTSINDLKSFEERHFQITHPKFAFDESRLRLVIDAKRPGVSGLRP